MKRLLVVALLLVACGGDSGPGPQQFEGTWQGSYTNSTIPQTLTATLHLTQDGQSLTGSLATNTGRTATLAGTANGDAFDATLQYTDGCQGTVTTSATLNDEANPDELDGDYTSNDCVGETSGTYHLVRQ